MNTSQVGQQTFNTLNIRIDTLAQADGGGRANYVYEQPYAVIRDEFRALAENFSSTQDEKSMAQLGLLLNEKWVPGAGISKQQVFQAHAGLVSVANEEYSRPSGKNVGSILAQATLSGIETALSAAPGMASWTKDGISASFLEAGFEAISQSPASRKQKSLAKKGLKALDKFEQTGRLPTSEMQQIAENRS